MKKGVNIRKMRAYGMPSATISASPPIDVYKRQWWDRAMDIIPTAGGKGTGIAHVLAAYGIDKADAMAFGDGNNDLEMFGAVGTGVAMANGSDALKAAATDICGACAEDGIHHYCVEHGLI